MTLPQTVPIPLVSWGEGHPLPIPLHLDAFSVYLAVIGASLLTPLVLFG